MYRQYGFETPLGALAASADEVIHLASAIGFTVDLNIASTDGLLKTDICVCC